MVHFVSFPGGPCTSKRVPLLSDVVEPFFFLFFLLYCRRLYVQKAVINVILIFNLFARYVNNLRPGVATRTSDTPPGTVRQTGREAPQLHTADEDDDEEPGDVHRFIRYPCRLRCVRAAPGGNRLVPLAPVHGLWMQV